MRRSKLCFLFTCDIIFRKNSVLSLAVECMHYGSLIDNLIRKLMTDNGDRNRRINSRTSDISVYENEKENMTSDKPTYIKLDVAKGY